MICNLYNQTKIKSPLNLKAIKKILVKTAKAVKFRDNFEVTVLLVSPVRIKALNKKFRHKNKITDVLSFSQREGAEVVMPRQNHVYLGDIVICPFQLKKQAKAYAQSFKKELALILCHGFLHLLGFEDETTSGLDKMLKKQAAILTEIND